MEDGGGWEQRPKSTDHGGKLPHFESDDEYYHRMMKHYRAPWHNDPGGGWWGAGKWLGWGMAGIGSAGAGLAWWAGGAGIVGVGTYDGFFHVIMGTGEGFWHGLGTSRVLVYGFSGASAASWNQWFQITGIPMRDPGFGARAYESGEAVSNCVSVVIHTIFGT